MASTETQTLKIIWKNKGEASLLKIAKELKISTDYSRLICRDLIKDKFIEFFERKYKITDLGRKELEKFGITEKIKITIRPPNLKSPVLSAKRQGGRRKGRSPAKDEKPLLVKPQKPEKPKEKPPIREKEKITLHYPAPFPKRAGGTGQAIAELSSFTPELIEKLCQKGFKTMEDIATSSVSRLEETIEGLKLQEAAKIINEARAKLRKEGKEYLWE